MAKQTQISKPSPRQTLEQAETTKKVRAAIINCRAQANNGHDPFLELCQGLVQPAPGQPGLEGCHDVEAVFSRIMGCDRWRPHKGGAIADFEGRVSFKDVEKHPEGTVFTYDPEISKVTLKTSEDRPKVVGLMVNISHDGVLAFFSLGVAVGSPPRESFESAIRGGLSRASADIEACDEKIAAKKEQLVSMPAEISALQSKHDVANNVYMENLPAFVEAEKSFEASKKDFEASKSTWEKLPASITPEAKAEAEAKFKDVEAKFMELKAGFDTLKLANDDRLNALTTAAKDLGELVARFKSIPNEIKTLEDSKVRAQKELREWTQEEELFKVNQMTVKTAKAVVKTVELV